jgi:hypothetical protein
MLEVWTSPRGDAVPPVANPLSTMQGPKRGVAATVVKCYGSTVVRVHRDPDRWPVCPRDL